MWEHLKTDIWKFVRAIILIGIVFIVVWKIIWSANLVNIDFATLLSVFLAFFSVALSVVFYFKAIDTSNAFYDNTYRFTQDIAGLLVKIESGFGEKLKSIDENYGRMRGYFEFGQAPADVKDRLRDELREEKEQFNKVLQERDALIKDLLARANMQEADRETFQALLKEKDDELKKVNRDVSRLSRDLTVDRVLTRHSTGDSLSRRVDRYIQRSVVPDLFRDSRPRYPTSYIKRVFAEHLEQLPSGLVRDMEKLGYIVADALTEEGVAAIADAIRSRASKKTEAESLF